MIIDKGVSKMSIFQEYEEIRKNIGEAKFAEIEKFLETRPEYFLSDVYYNEQIYKEFEQWQNKKG